MTTQNSHQLLADYARTGSGMAFQALVNAYVDLVYSTALRIVNGDRPLAEDVVQTVFIDLARKAKTLPHDVMLGGWLHRDACFVASKAVRGEMRRHHRERQAAEMSALEPTPTPGFEEIAPLLDEAVNQLKSSDHTAVVLRFFERLDFRSLGEQLGTTEDAARMRVNRALEKLQGLLREKGVALSAVTLGTLLTTEAVKAAPSGLAAHVAVVSLPAVSTAAATAAGTGLLQSLAAASLSVKALCVAAVLLLMGTGAALSLRFHSESTRTRFANLSATDSSKHTLTAPRASQLSPSASAGQLEPAEDLEALKQELRALLNRPLEKGDFPDRELSSLLHEGFQARRTEAAPILTERLGASDYECRHLALTGLFDLLRNWRGRNSDDYDIRAKTLSIAGPRMLAILRSPSEPEPLRNLAAMSLIPTLLAIRISPPETISPPPLEQEVFTNCVALLQSSDKRSEGLRFLVVQLLSTQVKFVPGDLERIREPLEALLQERSFNHKLLAAYGLSLLPGEKPSEVLSVLIQAVEFDLQHKPEGEYACRAVDGLGALGSSAAEAVPLLQRYAAKAKKHNNGSLEHAQEALCRIQPQLRSQYPAIDAMLRREEQTPSTSLQQPRQPDLAEALNNPELRTNLLKEFQGRIEAARHPEQERQKILSLLLDLWGHAPAAQRENIQQTMEEVRTFSKAPAPLLSTESLRGLLVDTRILLLNSYTPNRTRLEDLLNQRNSYYQDHPSEDKVTRAGFEDLSSALKTTDAAFAKAWEKEILRTHPDLPRILNSESASQ